MPPGPLPFSHRHFASAGLPAGGKRTGGGHVGSLPGERTGGAHRGVVEEHHAASAYFGEVALLRGPSFMPYS